MKLQACISFVLLFILSSCYRDEVGLVQRLSESEKSKFPVVYFYLDSLSIESYTKDSILLETQTYFLDSIHQYIKQDSHPAGDSPNLTYHETWNFVFKTSDGTNVFQIGITNYADQSEGFAGSGSIILGLDSSRAIYELNKIALINTDQKIKAYSNNHFSGSVNAKYNIISGFKEISDSVRIWIIKIE